MDQVHSFVRPLIVSGSVCMELSAECHRVLLIVGERWLLSGLFVCLVNM